jgi:hypothetical protein
MVVPHVLSKSTVAVTSGAKREHGTPETTAFVMQDQYESRIMRARDFIASTRENKR